MPVPQPTPQATPGFSRFVPRGTAALLLAATLSLGALGACKETVTPPPPAVARVLIAENEFTLGVGRTQQLAVTVVDDAGSLLTGRTITYQTSNQTVATVDGNGLVTAVGIGNATITATSEGKSAQASVDVVIAVASVSVAPLTMTLVRGGASDITAACLDASGTALTGRSIQFSSSNQAVATVTAAGRVAGVAPGDATITATCEGKSNTVAVKVNDTPVASIDLNPSGPLILRRTNTRQITATTRAANGSVLEGRPVSWSSTNPTIASVSDNGLITAAAIGQTNITARSEDATRSITINVTEIPISKVTVNAVGRDVLAGELVQLSVSLEDSAGNPLSPNGRAISWRSDNNPVATVNSSGVLLGVSQGEARITATAEAYDLPSLPRTVNVIPVPVKFVEVDPEVFSLSVNNTRQLQAVARDSIRGALGGRLFTWNSSNLAVATVSTTGLVTAVGAGNATITASTTNVGGGVVTSSPPAQVTVFTTVPASVQITPPASTLRLNESVVLTATVRDGNGQILTGRVVEWFSSNTQRVTVTPNPSDPTKATVTVISAPNSGTTGVTISAIVEGRQDNATITVTSQQ